MMMTTGVFFSRYDELLRAGKIGGASWMVLGMAAVSLTGVFDFYGLLRISTFRIF